jgi:programmed cell death 8 (apoptosis-inducing factor)
VCSYEAIGLIDASLPTVGIWAAGTPDNAATPAKSEEPDDGTKAEANSTVDGDATHEGAVDSRQGEAIVADLSSYAKGVVFYMRDDAVVGVVLWNMFGKIPLARKIIRSEKKFSDAQELAKLFRVHSKEPDHESE